MHLTKILLKLVTLLFVGPVIGEPKPHDCDLARTKPLYLDAEAKIEQRVKDLIIRLTLEEKAMILNHNHPDIKRLGLRGDKWNQCLNGVQWDQPTTLFPICTGLAATWDPDFIKNQVVRVISDEARAIYNGWRKDPSLSSQHKGLIYRDPVLNIGRNPYWGRNYEIWGEDPYLTGRMGVAYCQGMHGNDPKHLKLATTLKHYAVNNVEASRFELNATVSARMLHEYWLPQFRDAVIEGKANSLMASYNAINDTPNNVNHWLLTEVLKERWGHDGFVVSDLGGVKTMVEGHKNHQMAYVDAVAQSLMAGCDFSDLEYQENIPTAIREGKLTMERLNDALKRVLNVRFRLGEFDSLDHSPYGSIPPSVINCAAHHEVALEADRRSMVLLKNENHRLPLKKESTRKLAVIGPFADHWVRNWYNGKHQDVETLQDGLKNFLGEQTQVVSALGTQAITKISTQVDSEKGMSAGSSLKLNSDALSCSIEFQVEVIQKGDYQLKLGYKGFPSRGVFQAKINGEKLGAPIDMYRSESHYQAIAHLGETHLEKGINLIEFTVVDRNQSSEGFTGSFDLLTLSGPKNLRFELEKTKHVTGREDESDLTQKALQLAQDADAVILCLGSDIRNETEGLDRKSLGLPGNQQEFALEVLAQHPDAIVVLFAAGPLVTPELVKKAPTILQVWWPGQRGGTAIAEVLFGDTNPSGHLPYTVYASENQVPSRDIYEINQGFTYMYLQGDPLFPFGHGLSYSSFKYSNLRIDKSQLRSGGVIQALIDITNTGKHDGSDVVQLYTRVLQSKVTRPKHELKGFERVSLKAGETKTISIKVLVDRLAYFDERKNRFIVEAGDYELQIGSSSKEIQLREQMTIHENFNAQLEALPN